MIHLDFKRPSRRQLLRAGAAGVLFPWLGQLRGPRRAEAALPPTPRLVLLMQSNGTNQPSFWPTPPTPAMPGTPPPAPTMTSPILAALASDPVIASRMTLVKGLRNNAGGSGNGHDQGFAGLYSGYASVGEFSDPWGNGISIDHTIRKTLSLGEPFQTLHCGVLASDTPPFKRHRTSFSYDGPGAPGQRPTQIDPYRLYTRCFAAGMHVPGAAPGADPVMAARQRLARRKSVLDVVNADIAALTPRLPSAERERLDAHATSLRHWETQLAATLTPDPKRPPRCAGVIAPAMPDGGLDVAAEANVPLLIDLMFDFVTMALACQLVRVVTFQFGNGGEKWYYRWLDIGENSHDDIAHNDTGTDPKITEKVVRINRWYVEKVKRLCATLAAVPEASGTLFDNTLVCWGNELATGPHGMDDIPIVLLGGAAGRLPPGGRMIDQGAQDYRCLGTSLLNVMGIPATGFGQAPTCGPIKGLHG